MDRSARALAALGLVFAATVAVADCAPDHVELRGDWGQAGFSIELAETAEDRSRGLMFREHMAQSAGMLFIFDPPRSVSFWMRNTLIPLDMIFADRSGVVQHIHENAIPGDETLIPGGDRVFAVLEVNAGVVDAMGLGDGTQMQHPVFGDQAVWPCGAD